MKLQAFDSYLKVSFLFLFYFLLINFQVSLNSLACGFTGTAGGKCDVMVIA